MATLARGKVVCALVLVTVMGVALRQKGAALSATGAAAPEITGQNWLNSPPLRLVDLEGKVVLVEFWAYGCYNCRNVEPYVKMWQKKFSDRGLVIIAVHTPEFSEEHKLENVRRYVQAHDITYPVVTDNNFAVWERYGNHAWPTLYIIDKQGIVRAVRVGEGGYNHTEQTIQSLLAEK